MVKSLLYLTVIILVISTLLTCKTNLDPIGNVVDFGYSYHIIDPDSNIVLKSDSLLVFVSYSGCSGPHQFDIQFYTTEDEAKVWFKKVTPDEPCDMYIFHWLRVRLPKETLTTRKLIFLGPKNVSVILLQARKFIKK